MAEMSAETRAQVVDALHAQMKAKKAEEAAAFVASLPEPVQQRVESLRGLQKQHDDLEEEYRKEREALEAKYTQLYAPLYFERAGVIAGTSGPEAAKEPKGVPKFWLTALLNLPIIAQQVTEKDVPVLEYLRDISSSNLEGRKGFKLTFAFAENPYFENLVLEKSYLMADDEDPILEKIEGTDITWKTGKNITVKVMKQKSKKAGGKPLIKTEPCESFFNFFSPPEMPEDEDDLSMEEAEELQAEMEDDYDLGTMIRDRIIPNALNWFTGEAVGLEDLEGDDDEDDEEEDDDEDDDEDDEDEDEDDEGAATSKPKRMSMPKGAAGQAGKDGEQPPECKQQ